MSESQKNEMNIKKWLGPKRHYTQEKELSDFYTQMNRDYNYNHSRVVWEWLRNAPCLEDFHLDKFKMWKENGDIVSAARPLSPWLGEVVVDNRCVTDEILYDIIHHIEDNFSTKKDNKNDIFLIVLDNNDNLDRLLQENGYEKLFFDKGTLWFDLEKEITSITLKDGFTIRRLTEAFDFEQLSKVLWLGFNYNGTIPKIDDDVKLSIKHAWLNYNRDICSVVLDENGDYASFCGFWYDEVTQTAYLEPMVTLDKYRNMGLGKEAIYHSLKILKNLGCKNVFVDPDDEPYNYYLNVGFEHFKYARYFHKSY